MGGRREKTISLVPAAIDFFWWTNSYVPLWYKGKALPTPGSTVFVQARPSFPDSIAGSLVYTWSLNDEVVSSTSGQGKSLFIYTIPSTLALRSAIGLRVSNLSGTIKSEAIFDPPVASPEALAYELRPLEG